MNDEELAVRYVEEAAALNVTPPVRFVGMQFDCPMFQQDPPGIGSFVMIPGETSVDQAYTRACIRWEPITKEKTCISP